MSEPRLSGGRSGWRAILEHDAGRSVVAVLMACLTLAMTGIAALQQDASANSARLGRSADARALEAASLDASATVGGLRDVDVFRHWFAALQDSGWASGTEAESENDAAFREDLAQIQYDLSLWLQTRSPMLQPPYFDPATFYVDMPRFAAERAAETTRAVEQARVDLVASDEWGAKASAFVTILTLFAVALFFLGLAGTAAVRARRILLAAGLGLATIGGAWTVVVGLQPVRPIPVEAVDAVVRATVAGSQTPITGEDQIPPAIDGHFRTAIEAAETAVSLDGRYTSARRLAAEANLSYAFARLLSAEGASDETATLLRQSIAHWDEYLATSGEDPTGWWNSGFARYLSGDQEAAIAAANRVIELAPDQFVPYINRAIAQIAAGRRDEAAASVEAGLRVAAASRLDTNAFFFDQLDLNLARLAVVRPGEAEALLGLQRRLREAQVAIRTTGSPEAVAGVGEVEIVEVVALRLAPDGSLVAGEAVADGASQAGTDWAGLRIVLSGPADAGGILSLRAWRGLSHVPGFDTDLPWEGGRQVVDLVEPYGRAGLDFTAAAYRVEVYLGGATRAVRTFEVTPAEEGSPQAP